VATQASGQTQVTVGDLVSRLRGPALDRFLRYVSVSTEASRWSETTPTSPGQQELADMLAQELRDLGLAVEDADRFGHVYAAIPASPGYEGPSVGFVAHVDTSPDAPGTGVTPQVIGRYQGGIVELANGEALDPLHEVELREHVGHDLVTSDGTTLLGTDDKAGIAEIMTAVAFILQDPDTVRPAIRLAFTPDEEVGRGIHHFDRDRFGADLAYTLDGPGVGEVNDESFHGVELRITIRGRAAHPGYARDRMVNSLRLAAEVVAELKSSPSPEQSSGREGYIHPFELHGTVEESILRITCRDLAPDGLEARVGVVHDALGRVMAREPRAQGRIEEHNRFEGMGPHLATARPVIDRARTALAAVGIEARLEPIRGTTDGARLSALGLPAPNLSNGGHNFHSRTEWICVDDLALMSGVVVELIRLWGRAGTPGASGRP
jgi:tripeptide aminopeptidase